MKIAYVITRADVVGGASVHVLDLAEGVRKAGHEVVILAGGEGVFLERAAERNLRCSSLRYLIREIRPLIDILGFFELRRMLRELNPDLVHLHSSKAGILGRLAARSLNIPAIFTAHGWAFTEGVSSRRRALYRVIERVMAPFASRIITVSQYDRDLAVKSGVAKPPLVSAIHNGMPDGPAGGMLRSGVTPVKMVMVARFEAPKNHRFLVNCLAKMRGLSWQLEFVGDGSLLLDVQQCVQELDMSDRISFSGACDDVGQRLARADLFLLISDWEGLPLTILEAMRAELPVIASRVGGVPEAVEDEKTGFLVDRRDEAVLCASISKLILSHTLRTKMGHAGRKKFEREFTFSRMLDSTIATYEEVVKIGG